MIWSMYTVYENEKLGQREWGRGGGRQVLSMEPFRISDFLYFSESQMKAGKTRTVIRTCLERLNPWRTI